MKDFLQNHSDASTNSDWQEAYEAPARALLQVDICICTFRREHLLKTIRSIASQVDIANIAMHLIVSDNDYTDDLRAGLSEHLATLPFASTYIHAPAQNISVARNAAFAATRSSYVLCLDDDEIASPFWVRNMVSTLVETGADAVIGPVHAVYAQHHPAWMKREKPHSAVPRGNYQESRLTHIGNAGFRGEVVRGHRFDLKLGSSGGEDTAFFSALRAQGMTIGYCATADVYEQVSDARASLRWLIGRNFRAGQTISWCRKTEMAPRGTLACKASLKAAVCLLLVMLHVFRHRRAKFYLLRVAMHVGVIVNLIGVDPITMY